MNKNNSLDVIDTTVQKTREWVAAVSDATHLDTQDSYKALRAVLQTLRDRLPLELAAHFSAQLPMLLRGLFYEGWHPAGVHEKLHKEAFLKAVGDKIVSDHFIDPHRVVPGVFSVLPRFISPGEIDKVRGSLPHDLRQIWPSPVQSAL
ncbi:MAG TPA: DUF2267 domain-containing protein [Chthoniobacterales bacterium]